MGVCRRWRKKNSLVYKICKYLLLSSFPTFGTLFFEKGLHEFTCDKIRVKI